MTDPGRPAGPTRRLTRRRADTLARLLTAAAEVFAERGFGRTTVEDVCERAGFTRGAFYSNFNSLDALFFALSAERSRALIELVGTAVQSAVGEAADGALGVPDVMRRVVSVLPFTREHHLLTLEFATHALRHPEVMPELTRHRADLRAALIPIIEIGLAGAGRPLGADALDDIARAVIAANEGLVTQELLEPADRTLPELRRRTLTAILDHHRD